MQPAPDDAHAAHAASHQHSLATMANQIANFFRYQGDETEAAHNVARHLSHFWAPSMRRELVSMLDTDPDDERVDVLVRAAVKRYREELVRYGAVVPGEQALEQPPGGGDAG